MRVNIGTWEFDDRQRQLIARAMGGKGLATREQCGLYVARCFQGTYKRHAEAEAERERLAWRRGQPELSKT